MSSPSEIGFISLGVMGEPMCGNLARKSGAQVIASDLNDAPLERLSNDGVTRAPSVASLMAECEVVSHLCRQEGGLLANARSGQIILDLSTSPVETTRALAAEFAQKQATFASDVTLCGPVGCGQVPKILNNMVLFETVVAISEAKAIGERSGVQPVVLFETLAKGSADSFALRNHGMKAVLPGEFPERAFSVRYARKDLMYALDLADATGVDARGARVVEKWFDQAIEAGHGEKYHPVISRLIFPE